MIKRTFLYIECSFFIYLFTHIKEDFYIEKIDDKLLGKIREKCEDLRNQTIMQIKKMWYN